MPFKKGRSGNPDGRKLGKPNRTTTELKELLQSALEGELENIPKVMESLPAKERIEMLSKFLSYILPKALPESEVKSGGITIEEIYAFAEMIKRTTDPTMDTVAYTVQAAQNFVEHNREE